MPVNKNGHACGFGRVKSVDPVPMFQLLAEGYSYKEIAAKLNQSEYVIRDRFRRYKNVMKARNTIHTLVLMIKRKEINLWEVKNK